MMAGISLQPGIIYGPVLSRRLGRSLGINLLPPSHKVCSFDCVYCQYGTTVEHTLDPDRSGLPSISEVLFAVEKALSKPRTIETITFSGNGEPTLHPDFPEIVMGVKELRDRYKPLSKLSLLSNASRLNLPAIKRTMKLIDLPMLKLDAGDKTTFSAINQPVEPLDFSEILAGLKRINPVIIQSVLFDGGVSKIHGRTYESWALALSTIHPEQVHIYSTERPTALADVICLTPEKLKQIRDDLKSRFKLNTEAFWRT